ncbi:Zn-ribbon domain-containing OB-fold protein [Chloroflexota bacterium]
MAEQKKVYEKPLPTPSALTKQFWDGCKRHELLVQRCTNCGDLRWIPEEFCLDCLSTDYEWAKMSGEGKVYTFTIVRRPPTAAFQEGIPYVVAFVELKEGPRMMTNIVNCDPDEVKIGMPVRVYFDDVTDDVTLPKFEPIP